MVVNNQINSSSIDDWQLVIDATGINSTDGEQAARINLDVGITSDFVAVEITAGNQRSNWVNGGYVSQVYQFSQFDLVPESYFVRVGQVTLIELKQIATTDFALVYDPPNYFRDISIKVWQYKGIQTNLLLQQIATALTNLPITADVDFSEVNSKLSQIIANQNATVNVDLSEINRKLDAICTKLNSLSISPQPPQISKKKRFFICN